MNRNFGKWDILEYAIAILIWLAVGDTFVLFLKNITASAAPIFYYVLVVIVVFGYVWLIHKIFTKLRNRVSNK
jgi:Na+/glutamate symporter